MKIDPSYEDYLKKWSTLYEQYNYDEGLAGYFLNKSHEWCEKSFGIDDHFSKVLEVGAGTGIHHKYVKHPYDEYIISDLNPPFIDNISVSDDDDKTGKIVIQKEDATLLTFPDNSFDRLIAAHVLEHLYSPHKVLREWERVLKPGGVLSLVLPCDPGVAWRTGRYLSARKKFINAGIDYDYWMAREHVNPINNLVSFIRYYFEDITEDWRPFTIPSMDLNLFYLAKIRV